MWLMRFFAVLLLVGPLAFAQTDELELGRRDYKQNRYDSAIQHFKNAAAADPSNKEPHLCLATAWAQQYIPGVDTPDNKQLGAEAISEYEKVLDLDPNSIASIKGIAYLYLQMKDFETSKSYYKKAVDLSPEDSESYYSLGVIDWTQAYQPRMQLRARLGLKPVQSMIYTPQCWEVRDRNQEIIREGMDVLTEALRLQPEYDDAMAYINLMYRERADIQCGDPQSSRADLKAADKWVELTIASKQRKAERGSKVENSNQTTSDRNR